MTGNPKTHKRKGEDGSAPRAKKSKSGPGKWQTPHQKQKQNQRILEGLTLEAGDAGIWVTCQRGLERKAMLEMLALCDEYGEKLYNLVPHDDDSLDQPSADKTDNDKPDANDDDDDDDDDIEASIQKELASVRAKSQKKKGPIRDDQAFVAVRSGVDCVFFVKTREPVRPVDVVLAICRDAALCASPLERKSRHVNRLTPITLTTKANLPHILPAASKLFADHFTLTDAARDLLSAPTPDADTNTNTPSNPTSPTSKQTPTQTPTHDTDAHVPSDAQNDTDRETPASSYAIRAGRRNHNALASNDLTKALPTLIDPRHKVDLTTPDLVIVAELYKNVCGFSLVKGEDWTNFKKFNLNEIYKAAFGRVAEEGESQKKASPTEDKA